jgi:predicted nucleotidyltransferase component of viral defense system
MKDYALELAARQPDAGSRLNVLREYLQAYALRSAYEHGLFRAAAFIGGTALRFLYDLPRYSEDLDFSLLPGASDFSFIALMKAVRDEFELAGYDLAVTCNDRKTVNHAFFRFSGILQEAGLATLAEQKLAVRLEIDTHPPQGAGAETHVIIKHFPLSFTGYDLQSMFAGKLTALFCRRFTKGRDFFDAGWYLSKWKDLSPNMVLLANGLRQAGREVPSDVPWREMLRDTILKADWRVVEDDVKRLLLNPGDMRILSRENILRLL